MKVITLAVLVALVATAMSSTSGGGGSARRQIRAVNGRVNTPIQYPCRFDCLQLVTKHNNQPLFRSCQNSIVAYTGDFYGKEATAFSINYQCFTPDTYQTYFASRGKLAHLVNLCQDNAHRCVGRSGALDTTPGQGNVYSGLPNIADLAVVTTSKYYQWYSQFSNMAVVNNVVRCPANFRSNRAGRNQCNCDLVQVPELFEKVTNPAMPTAASDAFKEPSDVPTPVTPYSSYVLGFLGNFSATINPFPSVDGDSAQLVSQARLVVPKVHVAVHLGCIDADVDITSECD